MLHKYTSNLGGKQMLQIGLCEALRVQMGNMLLKRGHYITFTISSLKETEAS